MITILSQARSPDAGLGVTSAAGRVRAFWYQRPVRWQVLIAFAAMTVLATVIAGVVEVMDARQRTQLEMRAPVELAESFVRETMGNLPGAPVAQSISEALATRLKHLRHVRIEVRSADGATRLVPTNSGAERDEPETLRRAAPPDWFVNLVQPQAETRDVPLKFDGETISTVVISGEPADEIAEVWQDFRTMTLLWLGTNVLMLAALYVLLGRILDPLVGLADAMRGLESGNFSVRVPPPRVRELHHIADRFNLLATALDKANAENMRLCRDLISVQEEERRQLASELHDEVGPCLFGIMVSAASIERQVGPMTLDKSEEIISRVAEIRSISDRLKLMNRSLLKRLRPIALGRVTLTELIGELTADFERRHPEIRFVTVINDVRRSFGEAIDLTIYRCVQEGITNALRHSHASSVVIELSEVIGAEGAGGSDAARIELCLRDNGQGISDNAPIGFGIATMRERVRALNGTFSIGRNWPSGTSVNIAIPMGTPSKRTRHVAELIEDAR